MEETQELEDFSGFGGDFIDTGDAYQQMLCLGEWDGEESEKDGLPFDADDEDELGLIENVEGAILLAEAGETDLLALCVTVFFDVGLGALEDDATLFLLRLCFNDMLAWFVGDGYA